MAALEELCWALPVLMTYNWHSQVIILLNVIQVLLLLFLLSTRIDLVILSQLSSVVVGVIVLIVVIVAVFDIDNPLNRIVNCMSRRRRQERALISLEPSYIYIYMCLCMCVCVWWQQYDELLGASSSIIGVSLAGPKLAKPVRF